MLNHNFLELRSYDSCPLAGSLTVGVGAVSDTFQHPGPHFLHWVDSSSLHTREGAYSNCNLICHVWLITIFCPFLNRKGVVDLGVGQRRGGMVEELEGEEGGETYIFRM